MVEFDLSDDSITIKIPVRDVPELRAYQRSLMLLLKKVDISEEDEAMVEAVKKVYALLQHLTPEESTSQSLESLRFLSNDG
ncbi:MAG: hypothetical protein Roseis2KO_32050 [Roseivirga sp.]